MAGYHTNIEKDSLENNNFRRVLFTTKRTQLVLMAVMPGEDIGLETHDDHDQFIRIEEGSGVALLDGERIAMSDGSAVVIPAGTLHNIINTGTGPLRLYTLYAPPEHPEGTIHTNKAEAIEYEKKHHAGI